MWGILEKLGLGRLFGRGTEVKTVRLDIIAEQVREFNEAKKELNTRLNTLEDRAEELDKTVSVTLDISKENQKRLSDMETNINRVIELSEAMLKKGGQAEHEQVKKSLEEGKA